MLNTLFLAVAVCTPAPPVERIVAQIAARAELDKAGALLRFRKEWTEEDTTNPAEVRLKHTKKWDVEGTGMRFRQTLVQLDGKPVSNSVAEAKTQDPRREFLARYTLELADPCGVELEGRLHWQVAFRPRIDVIQPSGEDEDDLLNRAAGIMYVDALLWFVRSATGIMKTPYSVDIVGRVNYADIRLEQDEVDGVVVTRYILTDVSYSKWGRHYSKRIVYKYLDFAPIP